MESHFSPLKVQSIPSVILAWGLFYRCWLVDSETPECNQGIFLEVFLTAILP